ncbi:MAG: LuxR C-terminal-related transcriptional regulator [Geminicoccaceae bacterium]|nr:LuxR C-terminal-related transcriptional regulator [Geminicoccaceae bacterium]
MTTLLPERAAASDRLGCAIDARARSRAPSADAAQVRIADLLGLAVFVLDRDGALVAASGAARRLLAEKTILLLDGAVVRARHDRAERALLDLVRRRSLSVTSESIPVRLDAGDGGPAFLGLLVYLGDEAVLLGRARFDQHVPSTEALRVWFGLTPREAELCRLVARGWSPERAARAMGVAPATARVHLRNVFQKLRLSRQSELAFVVGSLPALELGEDGHAKYSTHD